MLLGDILAAARRAPEASLRWLEASEPQLAASLALAAVRAGEASPDYLRGSVAAFSALASEEDWATLTSRLRGAEDPAMACLGAMSEWRMAAEDAALNRARPGEGTGGHPGEETSDDRQT